MNEVFDVYVYLFSHFFLTYVPQYSKILMWHKSKEVLLLPPNKKMGRPTDNPKRHEIKARVDDETFQILNTYCVERGKSKAEGVRDGINKLKSDLKKN